jgi:hypothetical protein
MPANKKAPDLRSSFANQNKLYYVENFNLTCMGTGGRYVNGKILVFDQPVV